MSDTNGFDQTNGKVDGLVGEEPAYDPAEEAAAGVIPRTVEEVTNLVHGDASQEGTAEDHDDAVTGTSEDGAR